MKKQIAILAALVATSGFAAFGQDYLEISITGTKYVWDNSTTPGVGLPATAGEYDVAFLWAPTGTADSLPSVGTEFASTFTPTDQVATNGVTSTGAGIAAIQSMLSSGWSIGEYFGGGSNIVTTTGAKGAITASPGVFELQGGTGTSGSSIEMIFFAFNASDTALATGAGGNGLSSVTALGWSNPFSTTVGSGSSDPNAGGGQSGANGFGVAPVPEPTTLALAGLGGLSMLFLRRRKA